MKSDMYDPGYPIYYIFEFSQITILPVAAAHCKCWVVSPVINDHVIQPPQGGHTNSSRTNVSTSDPMEENGRIYFQQKVYYLVCPYLFREI